MHLTAPRPLARRQAVPYPALLATALLCIPLLVPPAGADEHGLQEPPETTPDTITAIALARQSGAMAAGTIDTGSLLPGTDLEADDDLLVWYLWNQDNDLIEQAGNADPQECHEQTSLLENPGVPDDCSSDVVDVAISADGKRLVVVSSADGDDVVTFANHREAAIARLNVTGAVTSVAASADAKLVVVGTDLGDVDGGGGRIFVFAWDVTPTLRWSHSLNDPVTQLQVTEDGRIILVAAGEVHYRFAAASPAGRIRDAGFSEPVVDLATSRSSRHLTAAGSLSGSVTLYDDNTLNGRRAAHILAATDGVQAVALNAAGDRLAATSVAGIIKVYAVSPSNFSTQLLDTFAVGAGVDDLAFDDAGRLLAYVARNGAGLLQLDQKELSRLWHDQDSDLLPQVAISGDGERVLTAKANRTMLFEAVHELQLSAVSDGRRVLPGGDLVIDVSAHNTGNRIETVALATSLPSGWTSTTPGNLSFPPGETKRFEWVLHAPEAAPPQRANVTLQAGGFEPLTLTVDVPSYSRWAVESGQPARSLGTDAQGIARFAVVLRNTGNVPEPPPVTVSVDEPSWTADLVFPPGTVLPGTNVDARLDLQAPLGAPQLSNANATVAVAGGEPDAVVFTATVGALFEPRLDGPLGVAAEAGNDTVVELLLRNDGNAQDGFQITTTPVPRGWWLRFQDSTDELLVEAMAPGEQRSLLLTITVPTTAAGGSAVQVAATATSLADPEKRATRVMLVSPEGTPLLEGEDEPEEDTPAVGAVLVLAVLVAALVTSTRRRR